MKTVNGLFVALVSAISGAAVFLSLVIGLLYAFGKALPNAESEAGPPLWMLIFLITALLGAVLSAVVSGLWGYTRYRQSLTNQSSKTPDNVT